MENQSSEQRLFTVELKSKVYLKNIMMTNDGSPERVMIEGVLGELVKARFAEGIILEVVGTHGMLNLTGYRTCCPFAPASTAVGIASTVFLFLVAKRMTLF